MLTTFFADILDFRRPQGRRYELDKILLLSVIAILCNAKSYRDISRFIKTKFETIQRELSLNWKSPPAYTTIRNIIQGIDKDEIEAAFRAFTQSMTRYGLDDTEKLIHIAVDGKVLRHSFDNFEDKSAMQKLSFFDAEQSLILGHVAIADKSNEIPAFQALLCTLEIPGAVFTADALHLQKKTFEQAAAAKHALLIQLKDNQSTLLEDVECLIKTLPPCDSYQQKAENAHGRITNRTTTIYKNSLSDFIMDDDWASYIKTVVQVKRSTDVLDTKTKQYINRQETAFYLSSHSLESAETCSQYVVQHWGIENKNHYVRDVSLQEDASRIRKNPYNLSVLRSTAMNIFRKNQVLNIKGELYENSLHWTKVFCYPQVT